MRHDWIKIRRKTHCTVDLLITVNPIHQRRSHPTIHAFRRSELMAKSWQPSGAWEARFREALDNVYSDPSLELLTVDYFSPKNAFSKIAPNTFGVDFKAR